MQTAAQTGVLDWSRLRDAALLAAALLRADPAVALPGLADYLLYDAQDVLVDALGNLELARDAVPAVQQWQETAPTEHRASRDWQRERAVTHIQLGNVLQAQGDLAGALAAYRASQQIRERLASADPSRAGWQRDLSVSHIKIEIVGRRFCTETEKRKKRRPRRACSVEQMILTLGPPITASTEQARWEAARRTQILIGVCESDGESQKLRSVLELNRLRRDLKL